MAMDWDGEGSVARDILTLLEMFVTINEMQETIKKGVKGMQDVCVKLKEECKEIKRDLVEQAKMTKEIEGKEVEKEDEKVCFTEEGEVEQIQSCVEKPGTRVHWVPSALVEVVSVEEGVLRPGKLRFKQPADEVHGGGESKLRRNEHMVGTQEEVKLPASRDAGQGEAAAMLVVLKSGMVANRGWKKGVVEDREYAGRFLERGGGPTTIVGTILLERVVGKQLGLAWAKFGPNMFYIDRGPIIKKSDFSGCGPNMSEVDPGPMAKVSLFLERSYLQHLGGSIKAVYLLQFGVTATGAAVASLTINGAIQARRNGKPSRWFVADYPILSDHLKPFEGAETKFLEPQFHWASTSTIRPLGDGCYGFFLATNQSLDSALITLVGHVQLVVNSTVLQEKGDVIWVAHIYMNKNVLTNIRNAKIDNNLLPQLQKLFRRLFMVSMVELFIVKMAYRFAWLVPWAETEIRRDRSGSSGQPKGCKKDECSGEATTLGKIVDKRLTSLLVNLSLLLCYADVRYQNDFEVWQGASLTQVPSPWENCLVYHNFGDQLCKGLGWENLANPLISGFLFSMCRGKDWSWRFRTGVYGNPIEFSWEFTQRGFSTAEGQSYSWGLSVSYCTGLELFSSHQRKNPPSHWRKKPPWLRLSKFSNEERTCCAATNIAQDTSLEDKAYLKGSAMLEIQIALVSY